MFFSSFIKLSSFSFEVGRQYLESSVLSSRALNSKTKSLFSPWKFESIIKSKYGYWAFSRFVFEWYLFQIIVCSNPNFNCCNNFALSCVDEVITGT